MKAGITGHQDICSDDTVQWVTVALERLIQEHKINLGLTCLARGADQLYAKILLQHNIPYVAIIASEDYINVIGDKTATDAFEYLLNNASESIKLDNKHANEQAFFNASKILVEKSDFIIAIWDGKPAKGFGGTGDVVNYAVQADKKVIHVDIINRKISNLGRS